jgi:F1F0 ATPase subunit 2
MNETLTLMPAWMAGGALGAIFFGGLWWTVRKAVSSQQPALWLFGSLLLRMSVTLTGFYAVSGGHWERLLLCLLGFVMARMAVTWLTRPPSESQTRPAYSGDTQEADHAP